MLYTMENENLNSEELHIKNRAYYIHKKRMEQNLPGDEVSDWLQAEYEITNDLLKTRDNRNNISSSITPEKATKKAPETNKSPATKTSNRKNSRAKTRTRNKSKSVRSKKS